MNLHSFLPVLRELARAYQAFEIYSAVHIRTLGLTAPQFDIVVTLGNTDGMNFKQLGEKTLITKGTLTGVIDRLQAKGLVRRVASVSDGRSQNIKLTNAGELLFSKVFPAHMTHIGEAFSTYSQAELDRTEAVLHRLSTALAPVAPYKFTHLQQKEIP